MARRLWRNDASQRLRSYAAVRRTLAYQVTCTVHVTDNYRETIVADPYRWLEDLKSPEGVSWAARQHQLAQSQLRTPLRDWIYARMDKYGSVFDGAVAAMGQPEDPAATRLVVHSSGTHKVLAVREAQGKAHVLVDGGLLGAGRDIARCTASPDGRLVAYGISDGGSDWVDTGITAVQTATESSEADLTRWHHALLHELRAEHVRSSR